MTRTALVTGDAGFIGRHMRAALTDRGYHVTGLDIQPNPAEDVRIILPQLDVSFDLVVHCAAVVGGRALIEGNPLAIANNFGIDSALFQYAARTQPKNLVYYSSSAAYPVGLQGEAWHDRLSETDINLDNVRNPDSTYGWAKLTGELQARELSKMGVAVHVFRPFSGYGSDQALDYPFPSFIARAAARQDPFDVWGPGTQVRDWIHVDDVINATLKAVSMDVRGPVNLGNGEPTSFIDLAHRVCEEAGYAPTILPHPDKPSGVHHRVCNPKQMHKFYAPLVSLRRGIRDALAVA